MDERQNSEQPPSSPTHLGEGNWKKFTYTSQSQRGIRFAGRRSHPPDLDTARSDTRSPFSYALAIAQVGDRVRIVALNCGEANNRLMGMGFMPNVVLEVVSRTATGSVIVALQDQRLGLGAEMAQHIQVIDAATQLGKPSSPSTNRMATMQTFSDTTSDAATVKLRDVAIGTTLCVVGYEPAARDYKRKLLAMGLTPGTELRVTRHAPLGDPTEISVRGFQLSLRKAEADALIVALVTEG
ncbi:MAG: FeoA family protein [Leptolyngbyaceae cyanobacterium bins.349]|nr:FeoA family protein [Leptolyngbyaceae cyanobacterium bins.349]